MDIRRLAHNELFRGIQKDSLERMIACSKAELKKYGKNQMIMQQDEISESLFVLLKGRVALVRNMSSGKRNLLYEVGEGDVFGEYCMMDGSQKQWYGAEALTEIELLKFPWKFFHSFCNEACEHHQQLVQNILKILAGKEWRMAKKLSILNSPSLTERIALWLLEEADGNDVIPLQMNREELADYLCVARPSLSRALMRMQESGMIQVGKTEIRILNQKKLENF